MRQILDEIAPDRVARELRAALLANDHEKATRLSVKYSQAVQRHWTALSSEERAASSLPKLSIELLTWAREMTLMQQAMAARHLSDVETAGRQLTARALYLQTAALDARG
ncbi:MAG: hypothetical protein WBE37_00505 [Bryobacteraceae bacterium]